MTVSTISTATIELGPIDPRHIVGEDVWHVQYLDPTTGEIKRFDMLPRYGSCPKRALESMGVPFDFGVEVTFEHIK